MGMTAMRHAVCSSSLQLPGNVAPAAAKFIVEWEMAGVGGGWGVPELECV